jgi:hypothetical protein
MKSGRGGSPKKVAREAKRIEKKLVANKGRQPVKPVKEPR